MDNCTHTPDPTTLAEDAFLDVIEQRATCAGCPAELSRVLDDDDGEGVWHWTRWKPAPVRVVAADRRLPRVA